MPYGRRSRGRGQLIGGGNNPDHVFLPPLLVPLPPPHSEHTPRPQTLPRLRLQSATSTSRRPSRRGGRSCLISSGWRSAHRWADDNGRAVDGRRWGGGEHLTDLTPDKAWKTLCKLGPNDYLQVVLVPAAAPVAGSGGAAAAPLHVAATVCPPAVSTLATSATPSKPLANEELNHTRLGKLILEESCEVRKALQQAFRRRGTPSTLTTCGTTQRWSQTLPQTLPTPGGPQVWLLFLDGSATPPPPPLSAADDTILDPGVTVAWLANTNTTEKGAMCAHERSWRCSQISGGTLTCRGSAKRGFETLSGSV